MHFNKALLTAFFAALTNAQDVTSYCDLITYSGLTVRYHLTDNATTGDTTRTYDVTGLAPGTVILNQAVDSCMSGVATPGVGQGTITLNANGFFNWTETTATSGVSYSAADVVSGGDIGGLQHLDSTGTTVLGCCDFSDTYDRYGGRRRYDSGSDSDSN